MSDTTGSGGVIQVAADDEDHEDTWSSSVLEATKARSDAPLREWAFRGAGLARIRWGSTGAFTRCTRILGKHMSADKAARICATWHHEATGQWPGARGRRKPKKDDAQ